MFVNENGWQLFLHRQTGTNVQYIVLILLEHKSDRDTNGFATTTQVHVAVNTFQCG